MIYAIAIVIAIVGIALCFYYSRKIERKFNLSQQAPKSVIETPLSEYHTEPQPIAISKSPTDSSISKVVKTEAGLAFCSNCGNTVKYKAEFCPYCGNALN